MTARLLRPAALIASLLLGACAAAAPASAPGVVATAGHDKGIADFRQDDADCRQAAAAASESTPAGATSQQRYDARYANCMGAKGNRVEQALRAYPLVAAVVPPMVGMGGGGRR